MICLFICTCCAGQINSQIDTVQLTVVYLDSVGNYYTIYGIDSVNNEKYKIISIKDTNYEDNILIGPSYLLHLRPYVEVMNSSYIGFCTGERFIVNQWRLCSAIEIRGKHYEFGGYDINRWKLGNNVRHSKRKVKKIFRQQAKIRSSMPALYESAPLME